VVVFGDKESNESLAIREHGGGRSTLSLAEFRARLSALAQHAERDATPEGAVP
jgi:hypothetical protein